MIPWEIHSWGLLYYSGQPTEGLIYLRRNLSYHALLHQFNSPTNLWANQESLLDNRALLSPWNIQDPQYDKCMWILGFTSQLSQSALGAALSQDPMVLQEQGIAVEVTWAPLEAFHDESCTPGHQQVYAAHICCKKATRSEEGTALKHCSVFFMRALPVTTIPFAPGFNALSTLAPFTYLPPFWLAASPTLCTSEKGSPTTGILSPLSDWAPLRPSYPLPLDYSLFAIFNATFITILLKTQLLSFLAFFLLPPKGISATFSTIVTITQRFFRFWLT